MQRCFYNIILNVYIRFKKVIFCNDKSTINKIKYVFF